MTDSPIQTRIRFKLDDMILVGPGKVDLLQAVARTGSISAAARAMGMSYRRAWILIDEMNRALDQPVVDTAFGGKAGGGSQLTPFGQELCDRFRQIEQALQDLAADHINWLTTHLRS